MVLITESRLRNMRTKNIPNPYSLSSKDKLTPAAKDYLRERKIEIISNNRKNNSLLQRGIEEAKKTIPIGASNRHIHLTTEDIEILFGNNYELVPWKDLSQPGQFAAEEKVTLVGSKGIIQNVRVLGPARSQTQIEISKTDGFKLGVKPPVRLSGFTEDTPGITVVGPKGSTTLSSGVIIAKRHVHMSTDEAKLFDVKNDDEIIVRTEGERPTIFTDVSVRVNKNYALDLHIDLDEANASGVNTGDHVKMIGKNGNFL